MKSIKSMLNGPFMWLYRILRGIKDALKEFTVNLLSDDSAISTMRFIRVIVAINMTIEWQYNVWTVGVWFPSYEVLIFIAAIFGITMIQKNLEVTKEISKHDANNTNNDPEISEGSDSTPVLDDNPDDHSNRDNEDTELRERFDRMEKSLFRSFSSGRSKRKSIRKSRRPVR